MCYCQEDLCNTGTCSDEYCAGRTPASSELSVTPPFSQDQSKTEEKAWLVVGVVLGVATLIAAIIFGSFFWYYFCRKRCKTSQSCETLDIKSVTDKSEFRVQTSAVDLSSVELVSKLGNGRFSEVWKATLNNKAVAVKIFLDQDRKYWSTEVRAYTYPHMKHENVCGFITESQSNGPKPGWWIVLEYYERGSLQDYLKVHTLTKEDLCKMAGSVACGLAYLHSEMTFLDGVKPAMAHRDVKSVNVLVKEDVTCCICDLGLSVTFEPGRSLLERQAQVRATG